MQLQDDLAGDAAGMVAPLLDVYGQGHVGRAVPERPQQVGSLTPSFAVEAEEMVGAYLQAGATCAVEIVFKVGVAESRAFRCFDVDETDAVGGHRFIRGHFDDTGLWVCSFTDPPISRADWLLWQHSHSGRVDGVAGPVDLNTFCGDSAAWRTALSRWAGQ